MAQLGEERGPPQDREGRSTASELVLRLWLLDRCGLVGETLALRQARVQREGEERVSELFTFDGKTFSYPRDSSRLTQQIYRVFSYMRDGAWRTLGQIAEHTKDPEASVSARLRDIRKPRFQKIFGKWKVERRFVRRGLFEYRLLPVQDDPPCP